MENKIKEFISKKFGHVRTVIIDGTVYFVGIDITKALGYSNPQKAIRDHCKGVNETFIPSKGGRQKAKVINKSDIYRLIIRSKLPDAEEFETWIFDEVIPQIELTGGYIPIKETDDEKLILAKALQIMQRTVEEKDTIIDSMRHKADTYDDIMDAKNTFDMNAVGKIVGMGEYKLFEYLRNKKILFYNSNNDNVPYERFMKAKYFSVIDTIAPNGETHSTTRVYQKGIDYILKQLKKDKKNEYRLLEVSANA